MSPVQKVVGDQQHARPGGVQGTQDLGLPMVAGRDLLVRPGLEGRDITQGGLDCLEQLLQIVQLQRVSVASDGGEANSASSDPVIDAEGKRIVFTSGATNLVVPDSNGFTWDVFVHDRESGDTVSLSSHLASGGQRPAIGDDGNTVSFTSSDDIYRVDLSDTGTSKLVVTNMQFSALSTAGEAIVVSGYNSLAPEDINSDKDVYLLAADEGDDPPDDTEICDDGIDNDGDGRTDCRDRDCWADPVCSTGGGGGRSK